MMRALRLTEIHDAVAAAPEILIATDFDGTICSLADRPESVRTSGRAIRALEAIAASPNVTLAVLTGRSLADIRSRMDVNAIYAGNHGLEIAGKGFNFVHPEAERLAPRLRHVCEGIREAISPWQGAWVEDKRLTSTVHLRACPTDHWIAIRDAIRSVVRPVDDVFWLRNGRAAFEISPRTGWDKGAAVKYIERELRLDDALVICVGDDETDETMFRAVPDGITIRVAPNGESDAAYSVVDSGAVLDLFEWIVNTSTLRAPRPVRTGFGRERPVLT